MLEILIREIDEVRRNLNSITKRVKAAAKVNGKGAAELNATLGAVTLKLTKAQALDLYDAAAADGSGTA